MRGRFVLQWGALFVEGGPGHGRRVERGPGDSTPVGPAEGLAHPFRLGGSRSKRGRRGPRGREGKEADRSRKCLQLLASLGQEQESAAGLSSSDHHKDRDARPCRGVHTQGLVDRHWP
eukprot:9630803-Alexandrium_andersonii.AAC.1